MTTAEKNCAVNKMSAKIKKVREQISQYYDINLSNAKEIAAISPGMYDAIYNAFAFGYGQGVKTEKAAQRKKSRAV